ncbi:MAG TPA: transcriptional repressor [Candidatus Andersenbacteria bacterium]|nr:transcriptional repressor [Candidatus Andersenbacteria bacterium]
MNQKSKSRNTKTRAYIERLFSLTSEPISIRELFSEVQKKYPKTAYSTVFRIVIRLVQEEKIHPIDWRERGSRYEWAGMPHHHHITCQVCGKVQDLEDSDVNYDDEKIRKKTGFITKYHSIELEGICKDCQKK